ncbi:hypothetical protein BTUL_0082g00630 [Botrytis tulipae]|uniref:Uncharacterized protein n=1 Tax=Botrytis tulipae TaxID=87230 RepID=A0A4Z1EVG7_9HELO|nr:hypothetical protein BTUL_0082g00630 [Botrytis tulipae]
MHFAFGYLSYVDSNNSIWEVTKLAGVNAETGEFLGFIEVDGSSAEGICMGSVNFKICASSSSNAKGPAMS